MYNYYYDFTGCASPFLSFLPQRIGLSIREALYIPWTGPGFWTGLDSGLDSWIMAQFCTRAISEARLTSRCPSYSPSPMQELDFQYTEMLVFNFNSVTVRVTYTTKS